MMGAALHIVGRLTVSLTTTHWRTTPQTMATKNVFRHYPVSAGVGVGEIATNWEPLVQTNKWISTKRDWYLDNQPWSHKGVCQLGNKGKHLVDLEQITGLFAKKPQLYLTGMTISMTIKKFLKSIQLKYRCKCVCASVYVCVCVLAFYHTFFVSFFSLWFAFVLFY